MPRPLIGIASYQRMTTSSTIPFYACNQEYIYAIEHAGGTPILIPPHAVRTQARQLVATFDGILLPGGDDIHPSSYAATPHVALGVTDTERDHADITLARAAILAGKPLLGICRGMQIINVACGGTLYQDLPTQYVSTIQHIQSEANRAYLSHMIVLDSGSRLKSIVGSARIGVNSYHHQAIEQLGKRVQVAARATDGIVEAIEIAHHPFAIAVQYHPESLPAVRSAQRLFRALILAAKQAQSEKSDLVLQAI